MLLVQNLLNGQQLDDSTRSAMKRHAFLLGVAGVAERDEEPALAAVLAFVFALPAFGATPYDPRGWR